MPISEIKEVVFGYGHENLQATHKTTLEITKNTYLSKRGDCIVAVAADEATADLTDRFKDNLRKPNAKLTITIDADGITDQVQAQGSPRLILAHPMDMVIRKSDYVCNRTLAVHADKAAYDISRTLVEKLKNPKQKVKITFTVRI